ALRVEEQRAQQVPRVVERRRLAGALLLEDLDQRLLLARGRILLQRQRDEDRVVEQLQDRLVRARVELEAGARILGRQRAEQRRDRQLALAVDAGVDDALLVDLELEPRPAARHQVRGEDLLRRVLGLHQVGAGRADELRDDHALGAVDDERALLGHHREVAHEDPLLADLAGLLVDEADRHRERDLVGQVLLPALLDRELGLPELVLAELHRERAGVVLDRRDVVDRLAKAFLQEPVEAGLLDVDQVGEVENMLQARERLARVRRSNPAGQMELPPLEMSTAADERTDGREPGKIANGSDLMQGKTRLREVVFLQSSATCKSFAAAADMAAGATAGPGVRCGVREGGSWGEPALPARAGRWQSPHGAASAAPCERARGEAAASAT